MDLDVSSKYVTLDVGSEASRGATVMGVCPIKHFLRNMLNFV